MGTKPVRRLMAVCMNGSVLHQLIILYETGRNGKDVWLRVIEKMLGREPFAIALRPKMWSSVAAPKVVMERAVWR